MKVYLSGGIMNFNADEQHGWRNEATKKLNCETIDPTRISYKDRPAKEIVELDKSDIDSCSHILVYFIRPSVGTSMEVIYSWAKGKQVYLVNPNGVELSPWLVYHSSKVFNTLDDAINELNRE